MIFQSFVKGGTERVNYGLYEYPPNAEIIFDFGNPICTSAFDSSRIVYNVGSANVTGSLIAFNNPTPVYPVLVSAQYGTMVTQVISGNGNYLQWDWKSNENQTSIFIYRLNGASNGKSPYISPNLDSAIIVAGDTFNTVTYFNTSGTGTQVFNEGVTTSVSNGRNGYNMIVSQATNTNNQYYWQNTTLVAQSSTAITRQTSAINQTNQLGLQSNFGYLGFLQYPYILTPKQIRQVYKCFSQRFFVT